MTNYNLDKYRRWSPKHKKWLFFYMLDNEYIDSGIKQLLLTEWRYAKEG